jgi:hypothetical protein
VGLGGDGFAFVECAVEPEVAEYCRRTEMQLSEGQIAEVNLEAERFRFARGRIAGSWLSRNS